LETLRQKIKSMGDVKLVIIDPISAYFGIGKIDSFRTTDVRAVLTPLATLAAEMKVAIVGVMHFNKKWTLRTRSCASQTASRLVQSRATSMA
jgi:putative DNA primase/helicase